MARLKNKIALITGAARGIGNATARLFIEEGATVIITDIEDDEGEALAKALGSNAHYKHLDVSSSNDWAHVMGEIQTSFPRLDILFNNAGITGLTLGKQDPEHISLEDWQWVHRVNLESIMLGCQHAIKLMQASGGSIINMSSRSGIVGVPGACAYASSKAAIRNHSKSVALYCAEKGYSIRCNTLLPAAILTPIWDDMLGTGEERESALAAIVAGIPMGKIGQPIDVAYAALYLASDESGYLTGSEITIDGGILAGAASTPKPKES